MRLQGRMPWRKPQSAQSPLPLLPGSFSNSCLDTRCLRAGCLAVNSNPELHMAIIITDEDARRHLDMKECIDAMRVCFQDFADQTAISLPRVRYTIPKTAIREKATTPTSTWAPRPVSAWPASEPALTLLTTTHMTAGAVRCEIRNP